MSEWISIEKKLPITPFIAYWTDGRTTVIEEGDSVSYAISGDCDKRVIAWMQLPEPPKEYRDE